jgi:hypothetical protein
MTTQTQQYDVLLYRTHRTRTRAPFPDSPGLTLPVSENLLVRVCADFDALDGACDDKLTALASESAPADSDWTPWRLEAVREAYDFVEPPAPAVAADSPAGLAVALAMASYPTLYGNGPYSAYEVFEHWFCTVGNGLYWTKEGVLCEGRGEPATPALVAQARERAVSAEMQAKLEEHKSFHLSLFGQNPCPSVPVALYPLSENYSALYQLPDNIEDSFLVAAFQLCQYLLSRPVWENYCYSPADLSGRGRAVYDSDAWRHIVLAEGMRQRTGVACAYARMVLHPVLGGRLRALGCVDTGFGALDYRLPPRSRRIDRFALPAAQPAAQPAQAGLSQVEKVIAGLQILHNYDHAVYCEHDILYAGGGNADLVTQGERRALEAAGWRVGEHGWERSV